MTRSPPAHPAKASIPVHSDASAIVHQEQTEFEKNLLPALRQVELGGGTCAPK
ncbi:MAG: hypothetical protein JWR07_3446 [Nevskia sp.]|nr:hypothetical protein [Nevskia sp.]